MFSLIPRGVRFFDLFEPQSQHSIEASQRLHDLVHHFDDARAEARAIKEVERQGDLLPHEPSGWSSTASRSRPRRPGPWPTSLARVAAGGCPSGH